jgi:hypothetical protein
VQLQFPNQPPIADRSITQPSSIYQLALLETSDTWMLALKVRRNNNAAKLLHSLAATAAVSCSTPWETNTVKLTALCTVRHPQPGLALPVVG